MSCIENPLSPCAMTGACAVLSGFKGLAVVVHGSSGCYYYPKALLKTPLYSTFLLESEIVLGTVDRLKEVVSGLEKTGKPVAVVNTCVPALTGEDLSKAFAAVTLPSGTEASGAVFVDTPGYIGDAAAGAAAAYKALDIRINPEIRGVNIDGVLSLDLFARGNLHEAERLLSLMHIPAAVRFASDTYAHLMSGVAPFTVSVNPSWDAGVGTYLGSFLFPELKKTAEALEKQFPGAVFDVFYEELSRADEQMFYYADKYLRKYAPPRAAVTSGRGYCEFADKMLRRYFGSDAALQLSREEITDYTVICEKLQEYKPDLLLGSSFEAAAVREIPCAFVGMTHPDRSRISMSASAVSGIEGGISFMERCINALIDVKKGM
ncbi:MAG TPA: oxidoreductase [Methanocorpusculum sp.]|nr:oxidoreductase [Methanocorpusculum sp.]